MLLASVVVDFRGAARIPPGMMADAFMAQREVVTVKVPGEGASAEFRADIEAATREQAHAEAVALAVSVGEFLGTEPRILAVKLQTEGERLRALEGAAGYGPFGG